MSLSEKNRRKRHGGPARPARTRLEEFYAKDTGSPLADAFENKGAVHPFVGMSPVPEDRWQSIWRDIVGSSRKGKSVAYFHIPFCENHCLFCGFYQNAWRKDDGPAYADMVMRELAQDCDAPYQSEGPIHAVYFGGGTPSALEAKQLRQLLEGVRKYLPLAPDCEITIEGRVHNFTEDKAKACFDGGANRLSIGVQSFKESLRNRMGRKADRNKIISFLESLVAADQAAIVVDLIYGFPDQSLDDWADDVKTVIATGIHGVDLYSLNLIPSTPLVPAIEKGKFSPPVAASRKGEYYELGSQIMHDARWEAISSTHWRRDTRERNLYNLLIKSGANCLAFGSGAGGMLNGHSFRNDGDLAHYMQRLPGDEKSFSFMMRQPDAALLFNRIKGEMELGKLNIGWLSGELGPNYQKNVAPLIEQWRNAGLLSIDGDWLDLTLAGRYWQVTLTVNLLEWIKLGFTRAEAA